MNARAMDVLSELDPSLIAQNISTADDLSDVGAMSIRKVLKILRLFVQIFLMLLRSRPRYCYFALCPNGIAFYRDVVIISLLKCFRVRTIIHLHGRVSPSWPAKQLYSFAFAKVDVIHLSAVFWRELQPYMHRGRYWIVPNCTDDLSDHRYARTNDGTLRFFYFSNFVRGKGVLYLLEAALLLHQRNVPCKITLAGAWFDLELKRDIEDWQENNQKVVADGFVSFCGPLYGQEKKDFFSKNDVLVFPSYIDTFPLVLIEAMSAHKAVIACDTGAVREILDNGRCGVILPEHDAVALAEAMQRISETPDLAIQMGKQGRDRYQAKYTHSIFNMNLTKVINEISLGSQSPFKAEQNSSEQ